MKSKKAKQMVCRFEYSLRLVKQLRRTPFAWESLGSRRGVDVECTVREGKALAALVDGDEPCRVEKGSGPYDHLDEPTWEDISEDFFADVASTVRAEEKARSRALGGVPTLPAPAIRRLTG
jgi:hypothetical protein